MLALAVALDSVPISGRLAADASADPGAEHARGPAVFARSLAPSGNPLWGIPLGELSATSERPIFSPSRRRPAPVIPEAAAAQPPPAPPPPGPTRPPLVLIGTIVGESRQIGVFLEETTKEMVRLAIGERHGGWLLHSVDKRGVAFERGARTATLTLRPPDQHNAPGPEAAPVAELIPPVRHRKR
jgi:general secretion pathway protein N